MNWRKICKEVVAAYYLVHTGRTEENKNKPSVTVVTVMPKISEIGTSQYRLGILLSQPIYLNSRSKSRTSPNITNTICSLNLELTR
jgi:hypothetical protein